LALGHIVGIVRGVEVPIRVLRAVSLAAVFALLVAGAALADTGGQGTVTTTQQYRDILSFTASVTNPCTGASGTLSATAKTGVFHVTSFTTGPELWVTTTDEGTATFTPDDPTGVVASGHYAEWFGESFNNRNAVVHDTSTFRLIGTDGSRTTVHIDDHFSINANGVVTVTFSNFSFTCG
jgi:hypothetical protein